MERNYFTYQSPIGSYRIVYCGGRIVEVRSVDGGSDEDFEMTPFAQQISRQLDEYFSGERQLFDLALDYSRATPFQARVYAELLKIPYGESRTYKEIATAIGNPKASRAVGMANNRNPIAIIIPCHRVVGTNGSLVGYAGGLSRKEYLLNLEGQNR